VAIRRECVVPLVMSHVIVVLIFCLSTSSVAAAWSSLSSSPSFASASAAISNYALPQSAATQSVTSSAGRVVATVAVEGLRIPAVAVELRNVDGNIAVAKTTSDVVGQVTFPDVPAGRYVIRAVREGFADAESAPFTVRGGSTEQVLVEMRLTFVRESVDVVVPANSPTESLQPVAVSDVLTGAKMDIQPLAGDDFQSLLTLLPSIIRGPDGRLRVKGGTPTTGALQMSSASLNDPSTGDFDLELPSGAVESVEVLSNPFAAEYGRFSTSVTQVRTKRGTNDWIVKPDNLIPGFGKGFAFVNKFEPRLSISGPLKRDRLLFGEYLQYRFVRTPVKSLPDEPQIGLDSFDSFTRLDGVLSSRHALTGGVIYFPRKITNATLSTFRPPETTPKFTQEGFSAGAVDRLILSANAVLESTLAVRHFEVDQKTKGELPMVYAPQGQSGNFFSRQERNVDSLQLVEALTYSKEQWAGQHLFKVGLDLQHSGFNGVSFGQQVDVQRLDGSLAERTTYVPPLTNPDVSGTEFAAFAQDRWRVNDRLMFELGIRADRDDVVEHVNFSPRAGMSVSLLPDGRGILRGGIGKFAERTPLAIGAFTQYEVQTISRFAADGRPLGAPVTFAHVVDGSLKTPESIVQTVAWDQRLGRRFFFKAAYLHRNGSHAYIVDPDASRGLLTLSSVGASKYWELETTGRYLANEHRDLTVSYVRSHSTRDLNDYDQFFGNFRNPIIRPNENSLSPTDVPNRLIVRGTVGLPAKWVFSPVYEWRTGFPWSAVDEFQDFVGTRNRSGRLPTVSTLDFTLARPLRFRKYHFTGGIKVYNVFDSGSERDVQANIASPNYGTFYNPIQRSIGFVVSSSRP
jgi:TonB dependent receptor-like, beta-barrel/Carboxypeptidase regulatory-like domain